MFLFPYLYGPIFFNQLFDIWYRLGGYVGLPVFLLALAGFFATFDRGARKEHPLAMAARRLDGSHACQGRWRAPGDAGLQPGAAGRGVAVLSLCGHLVGMCGHRAGRFLRSMIS